MNFTQAIINRLYTKSYTINANNIYAFTANDLEINTPTGYIPIAIAHFSSGNNGIFVRSVNIHAVGTETVCTCRNITSNNINADLFLRITYIKNIFK